jgi:hypothetical protein
VIVRRIGTETVPDPLTITKESGAVAVAVDGAGACGLRVHARTVDGPTLVDTCGKGRTHALPQVQRCRARESSTVFERS